MDDEESQCKLRDIENTDKEIDQSLDIIDDALERCLNMAKGMKEEMMNQTAKLDKMGNGIESSYERTAKVSKRIEVIHRNIK